MNRPDSRQGLDLEGCVHQVRGFVKDRCSDVCAFLRLDKRVKPDISTSSGSSLSLQAPIGSRGPQVSGAKRGNNSAGPTLIGTSDDHTISREELGRATWLLLHTLAAQYPDTPSKQQKKDVTAMVRVVPGIQPQMMRTLCI